MDVSREVEVVESCMVTPIEQTPSHGLWLSPIDLAIVSRGLIPTVYFYSSSSSSGVVDDFFDVTRLKLALAKALVAFYPLAGRLSVHGDGRAEIDCAGQGVLFAVARSDLAVADLVDSQPSPELRRLFAPRVEDLPSIMCAIQVTFMGCGGVVLGTALHHAAVDAPSVFHFFRTWSAFSRDRDGHVAGPGGAALELPCHDRTLLRARTPPMVHPDAFTVFCPKLSLSETSGIGPVVSEIFAVSKDQVAALKRACTSSGDGGRVSTFVAVSAHVWRSMCAARRLPPDATTRLTFPANVRRLLRPPLPARYFGNAIITLGTAGKVRDIGSEELASVAGRINGVVRRMDDELVRSAIDYLEMNGGKQPAGTLPETELRVFSWLGMPMYDADFGWGKPLAMHRALEERGGIVYLMDGLGGGVRILVSAEAAVLKDFQRLLYAII
ncbi:putrescine hydroxycinnamoyltransferase 1-like [Triticum dicoccoides]|uniref:putrescine hydroxycinnamoyltransferase 1-like n=1 Tax=Triticum dicoccoides TaxID=85692 RepID=UPI00188E5932|nr:putrescine hydroxycinnamoyltransferase 1-like [Triticum dicoccoides]